MTKEQFKTLKTGDLVIIANKLPLGAKESRTYWNTEMDKTLNQIGTVIRVDLSSNDVYVIPKNMHGWYYDFHSVELLSDKIKHKSDYETFSSLLSV